MLSGLGFLADGGRSGLWVLDACQEELGAMGRTVHSMKVAASVTEASCGLREERAAASVAEAGAREAAAVARAEAAESEAAQLLSEKQEKAEV